MPSAAAKPCSRAATSTAQSTSGTNAAATRSATVACAFEQRRGRDERAREIADLAVLVHRGAAQQHVGVLLGEIALLHQNGLGLVDDLAILERRLGGVELALEPIERMEAADRDVEDRLHSLLAEPVDDVGRHAGVDG